MALYRMVGGKIHRATVTETELDYEGSISIDPDLYERAGFTPGELLQVAGIHAAGVGRDTAREVDWSVDGDAIHVDHIAGSRPCDVAARR